VGNCLVGGDAQPNLQVSLGRWRHRRGPMVSLWADSDNLETNGF
jgi:hypothetical protein